ncbi:MAG: hypothetical protein WC850_05760 [Candidatus Gracilibacteria bacterium]
MYKHITKKLALSLFMGIFMGLGIFITYAATSLISINDTINPGDTLSADWYNDVKTRLINIYSTGSGGNVGIGTNSPTQKLEVNGTVKATSFIGNGASITTITPANISAGTAGISITGNAATATNANTVDSISSESFLRSDANDNLTAAVIVPTTNRDQGIFGSYDSTKTQHIWSMGTAYRNAADGTTFGNLYGLAYKYNGSAGGHGVYLVQNGTATAGIGSSIWTSGNLQVEGNITANGGYIKLPNSVGPPAVCSSTILGAMYYDSSGYPCVCISYNSIHWAPTDNWSATCN